MRRAAVRCSLQPPTLSSLIFEPPVPHLLSSSALPLHWSLIYGFEAQGFLDETQGGGSAREMQLCGVVVGEAEGRAQGEAEIRAQCGFGFLVTDRRGGKEVEGAAGMPA